MRGGLFFGCDLARAITTSLEILPVRVQGYSLEEINEPEPTLKFDLFEAEVSGRALLLVDDICDSGRTLKALKSELEDRGASTIKAAVLIRRESEGNIHLLPDYVGFNYAGSEWFVGYGMDDLDRYRNLNDIYVIN
jgi:hypoxanthine phosphoribosyltransferase